MATDNKVWSDSPPGTTVQSPTSWNNKPIKLDADGNPSFLTENLSEQNALPWQKYFDKNVSDTNTPGSLVNGQLDRGKDYYENTRNAGLDNVNVPMRTTPLSGGQNNPMSDAIASKYQRDVGGKLNMLKTNNQNQSEMDYSSSQGKAAKLMQLSQANKNKNFMEQYDFQMKRYNLHQQWDAANKAAEASTISNFLGYVTSAAKLAAL